MDDINFEGGNQNKTEWSMDYSTLMRINILILTCNQASAEDNIETWYKALINLYKEAITDIERLCTEKNAKNQKGFKAKELKKKLEKEFREYSQSVANYRHTMNNNRKPFPFTLPNDILTTCEEFEIVLRLILDEAGLLIKRVEKPKYAIG